MAFESGYEGCKTAGELGWKWGTETCFDSSTNPSKMLKEYGIVLTSSEREDFISEFYEARKFGQ